MFLGATPGKTIAKTPHLRPFFQASEVKTIFAAADANSDGELHYVEFASWVTRASTFRLGGGKTAVVECGGFYLVVNYPRII